VVCQFPFVSRHWLGTHMQTAMRVAEFPDEIRREFELLGIDDLKISQLIEKSKNAPPSKMPREEAIILEYNKSGERVKSVPAIVYDVIDYYEDRLKELMSDEMREAREELAKQPKPTAQILSVSFEDDDDDVVPTPAAKKKRQSIDVDERRSKKRRQPAISALLKKAISWCSLSRLAMSRVFTQMVFQLQGGPGLMDTFLRAIAEQQKLTVDYVRQFIDNSALFDGVLESWASARARENGEQDADFRTCILQALVPRTTSGGDEQRFARTVNQILESDNIYFMIFTLVSEMLPIIKSFLKEAFTSTLGKPSAAREDHVAEFEFKTCMELFYKIATMMENLVATARQENANNVIPSFLLQSNEIEEAQEETGSFLLPVQQNSSLLSMAPIWDLI